jgi:hypothetical protein
MLQEDPAQTHTQHETAHNHTGKARHGYTARTADATHRLDYARAANDVAFDGHRSSSATATASRAAWKTAQIANTVRCAERRKQLQPRRAIPEPAPVLPLTRIVPLMSTKLESVALAISAIAPPPAPPPPALATPPEPRFVGHSKPPHGGPAVAGDP